MRLDPEHVRKLARAISKTEKGGPEVALDLGFMGKVMARLSLWERGLLTQAIIRASSAKRKTIEQRIILAMFVHREEDKP